MPKTNPARVTEMVAIIYESGAITEVDQSKMDKMASILELDSRIEQNNMLSLEAHMVSIAAIPDTPLRSLARAEAYMKALHKDAYGGYSGTPKAIWLTKSGLPSDMKAGSSYHPEQASKRRGMGAVARKYGLEQARIVCLKHNRIETKCDPDCKVTLNFGDTPATDIGGTISKAKPIASIARTADSPKTDIGGTTSKAQPKTSSKSSKGETRTTNLELVQLLDSTRHYPR